MFCHIQAFSKVKRNQFPIKKKPRVTAEYPKASSNVYTNLINFQSEH